MSLVIFDLDGTLLDTIEDLSDSMNAVLKEHGFPEHAIEKHKHFVGNGMRNYAIQALPEEWRGDDKFIDSFCLKVDIEYNKRWNLKTDFYPGVKELLDSLCEKGVKIAVLSNKPDKFVKKVSAQYLSKWNFALCNGFRHDVPRKPDPAGVFEICRVLGVEKDDTFFVGDSDVDVKTGRSAGVFTIGVAWGFRGEDELKREGADAIVHDPVEILTFV